MVKAVGVAKQNVQASLRSRISTLGCQLLRCSMRYLWFVRFLAILMVAGIEDAVIVYVVDCSMHGTALRKLEVLWGYVVDG